MKNRGVTLCCAVAALLLLTSCATTSLVDTWRSPNLGHAPFHKIVVVSFITTPPYRHLLEDILDAGLKQQGVQVTAGHLPLPQGEETNRTAMTAAIEKAGADGLVTVQLVNVETQTAVSPGYVTGYGYPYSSWWYFDGYGGDAIYYPPYYYTYQTATFQVNLFDATGKIVWAATFETTKQDRALSVAKEIAATVSEQLKDAGLI